MVVALRSCVVDSFQFLHAVLWPGGGVYSAMNGVTPAPTGKLLPKKIPTLWLASGSFNGNDGENYVAAKHMLTSAQNSFESLASKVLPRIATFLSRLARVATSLRPFSGLSIASIGAHTYYLRKSLMKCFC
jgi:hypothetical protein